MKATVPAEALVGRMVSHYRVGPRLGAGGMSEVYRAEDLRLHRPVALKFLAPELSRDAEARRRFLREARAAFGLDHPNVCTVYAVDESPGGRPFIAMACYEGRTLGERLTEGPLPVAEAVEIARQAARGLVAAHAHGVLHRDVKPGNLMITPDGTVKLLDFGVARLTHESRITRTGTPLGTAAYMAPEQARGREVDARADVWSLGAVLYEMLAGRPAFPGSDLTRVLQGVLHRHPPPLGRIRPEVPAAVEHVVERALVKDPARRTPSAEALLEQLEALGRRRLGRSPLPPALRFGRLGRRLAVGGAALLGAMAVLGLLRPWAPPPPIIGSLVVMPFLDASDGTEREGLEAGLAEGLVGRLQRFDGLRVVPLATAMAYQAHDLPAPRLAEVLGVEGVMEGTFRPDPTGVALTVRLLSGKTGEVLWEARFRRPWEEIPGLQAQVAGQLADRIGLRLSEADRARLGEAARRVVDRHAFLLYVRGRHHWNLGYHTLEGVERARSYFEQAVQEDPGFAAAWAGIADTYVSPGCHSLIPSLEAYREAKRAVTRALALDPWSPEAQAAYGHLVWEYEYDWEAGEAAFRRALEINPNYAPAHHIYGAGLLLRAGRFEEGLVQMQQAVEANPLSANASADLAMALYKSGRFDAAEAQLRETRRAFPEWDDAYDSLAFHYYRAVAHEAEGRADQAGAELQKALQAGARLDQDRAAPFVLGVLGEVHARLHDLEGARAILQSLEARGSYVPKTIRARILAWTGEEARALRLLEEARGEREPALTGLPMDPGWKPLRDTPGFSALLARVGPGARERLSPRPPG